MRVNYIVLGKLELGQRHAGLHVVFAHIVQLERTRLVVVVYDVRGGLLPGLVVVLSHFLHIVLSLVPQGVPGGATYQTPKRHCVLAIFEEVTRRSRHKTKLDTHKLDLILEVMPVHSIVKIEMLKEMRGQYRF